MNTGNQKSQVDADRMHRPEDDNRGERPGKTASAGREARLSGGTLSTRRIEAFSDGVLSIVITLLVIVLQIRRVQRGAASL